MEILRTSNLPLPELDEDSQKVLEFWRARSPRPVQEVPLDEARNSGLITQEITGKSIELYSVTNEFVNGSEGFQIPIRIYKPKEKPEGPVLLYAHGGGWTMLSIDSCDVFLRELASQVGATVVSVGYRLSPENPYPLPFNDCWDVLEWVKAGSLGFEPTRIAVAGDSAGGNLAAGMSIKSRNQDDGFINFQLLLYPACGLDLQTTSMKELGPDPRFRLSVGAMTYFWSNYLSGNLESEDPYAIPARANSLSGVAPALVVIAGFDPLKDDGKNYAMKLDQDGVRTELLIASTLPHGFVQTLGAVPEARRVTQIIFSKLKNELFPNHDLGESQ